MNATTYAGPLLVTIAYVLVYYATMVHLLRTKSRLEAAYKQRNELFDRYFGQDREMLAADRIQLNMLEHMPIFLVLLWLHAVFVSPVSATVLGGIYTGSRALYPLMMGNKLGRGVRPSIAVATGPGYIGLIGLAGGITWAAVQGLLA